MLYETLILEEGRYVSKTIEATSVEDAMEKLEALYGKVNVPFVPYKIDRIA